MTKPLCEDAPQLTQEMVDSLVLSEKLQPHEYAGRLLVALELRPETHLVHSVGEIARETMDRLRSVYVVIGAGGIRSGFHVGEDAAKKAANGAEVFVLVSGSGEQIAVAAKRYGKRFPGDRQRVEWLLRHAAAHKVVTVSDDRLEQLIDLAMNA